MRRVTTLMDFPHKLPDSTPMKREPTPARAHALLVLVLICMCVCTYPLRCACIESFEQDEDRDSSILVGEDGNLHINSARLGKNAAVLIDGVNVLERLGNLSAELSNLRALFVQAATSHAGHIWAHTDPRNCSDFTPPWVPFSLYVELGGGGGGGGSGGCCGADGHDGEPGGATFVTLVTDGQPADAPLMVAAGGVKGESGGRSTTGQPQSGGSGNVTDALVLTGKGGAGGNPGSQYNGQAYGDAWNFDYTGCRGGDGGYVAGHLILQVGQTLRACVGRGGAGGPRREKFGGDGAVGANGFVIIRH